MNISHLKTYLMVASTKSFTRAAQELFTTQPTVTNHIQSLEEELGYQLFVRSGASVRLTAEGERLAQKVNEIFRLIDEVKGAALSRENGVSGTLNIAASSVMGAYYLPSVLKVVLEQYPNIDIQLHFGTAHSIAAWVQSAFVDLGFAPRSPGFAKLKFKPLLVDPCVIAAGSSRYAAYSEELKNGNCANQHFILREKGTKNHAIAMKWLKKQPWYPGMRAPTILANMESIKNLVLEGAGVTIIPRSCVKQEFERGLMKEIKTSMPLEDINYFMIERKSDKNSEIAGIFKRLLEAEAGR